MSPAGLLIAHLTVGIVDGGPELGGGAAGVAAPGWLGGAGAGSISDW